jgi:B-box zinc finger
VGSSEPTAGLVGTCAKHWNERATGRCEDCGELWCTDCLVPPTRKRQPTRCIDCALVAAGIRARGARRAAPMDISRTRRRPIH